MIKIKNIILLYLLVLFDCLIFADNLKCIALFSGPPFWILEYDFKKIKGISNISPVYIKNKDDLIAIKIIYNPNLISYKQLVDVFFRSLDPTSTTKKNIVYVVSQEQKKIVELFIQRMTIAPYFGGKKITLSIVYDPIFYDIEDHYQDYAKKNPFLYSFEKSRSTMYQVENIWNNIPRDFLLADNPLENIYTENKEIEEKYLSFVKPSKEDLKLLLSTTSFQVTQLNATEPAFDNEYFENNERGIYVDIVSGEPLFSSRDKIESKSGWPTFSRPIAQHFIVEKDDFSFFMYRKDVRSRYADSHLGYLFNDGPAPFFFSYCINSAALKFISFENMQEEGYDDYLAHV